MNPPVPSRPCPSNHPKSFWVPCPMNRPPTTTRRISRPRFMRSPPRFGCSPHAPLAHRTKRRDHHARTLESRVRFRPMPPMTVGELRSARYPDRTVKEELLANLLAKLGRGEALFP